MEHQYAPNPTGKAVNRPKIFAVAGVRFNQRSNSGRVLRHTEWLGRDVEGIARGYDSP